VFKNETPTLPLDVHSLRGEFPALALTHDGAPRIYLDNPAGTQLPQCVLDRMTTAMVEFNANLHGSFRTSRRATELVGDAHAAVADMVNAASPDEIVFGPNMTTLTFMMTRALAPLFEPGDEIVLTQMEHDANHTPWRLLAEERGLIVRILPFDKSTYEFNLEELASLITERTRFAAFNYASNILGTINEVAAMCAMVREVGGLTYVDAVQYAPHGPIDVQRLGCDLLVASPYKFYGPHQGVLWGREELLSRLPAHKLRVVPDVPPNRFETGCQSLAGQAGTLAAVEYLERVGGGLGAASDPLDASPRSPRTRAIHGALRAFVAHEETLAARLIAGLQDIGNLHIHGITDPTDFARRVPTVSFSRPGTDPATVAAALDSHGIYVWNGHSYALPVIEHLGLADAGGVVRIGPTHYNTVEEIDRTLEVLGSVLSAAKRS
jgi:cysteine desulfurase family protein (TIGR01976 family)